VFGETGLEQWGVHCTVTVVMYCVCTNGTGTVWCAVTGLATVDVTNRHMRTGIGKEEGVLLAMSDSRGTQDNS
jgi:hypothetical protein